MLDYEIGQTVINLNHGVLGIIQEIDEEGFAYVCNGSICRWIDLLDLANADDYYREVE